jgi:hypothetical protein
MTHSEKFAITLEAKPSSIPASARLKRLLKYVLRVCGLRCVEIKKEEIK